MVKNDEACGTCRFWEGRFDRGELAYMFSSDPGFCKRHGPMMELIVTTQHSSSSSEAVWPSVRADNWCGDYERREAASAGGAVRDRGDHP